MHPDAGAVIGADVRVMPYACCVTVTCINETSYSAYHMALSQRCADSAIDAAVRDWSSTSGSIPGCDVSGRLGWQLTLRVRCQKQEKVRAQLGFQLLIDGLFQSGL